MTTSLIYYMKYNFIKKLRQDMCRILGFGVTFSLELPTGKFPLWRQGSTPWNTQVSDDGVGNTSSECMKFSGAESDISTLRRERVTVDDNNNPAPENFMHSDDVFPTPSSLTCVFHGVYHWRRSGNFPVGSSKLKVTPNPRIRHMSCLNFLMKLYLMEYIKDMVITETNKCLNSDMNLSDYLRVIGCCLIMDCYGGHSVRDLFLKDPITPQKGTPIRRNHIVYGRLLENITQVMSYTNIAIPEFNNRLFQQR